MRLFYRLMTGYLVGAIAVVLAVVGAIRTIHEMEGELDRVMEQSIPVHVALHQIKDATLAAVSSVNEYLFAVAAERYSQADASMSERLESELAQLDKAKTEYLASFSDYKLQVDTYFTDEKPFLKQLQEKGSVLFAAAETVVRLAAAKGIGLELLVDATEGLEDAEVAFTTLIASVLQHEKSELAERHEAIEDSMWASIVGVATQVLAAFLILVVTGYMFSRSVIRRIGLLSAAAHRIAEGNLVSIQLDNTADELAALNRDFRVMTGKLRMAVDRRDAAESDLRKHRDELQDKVDEATAELRLKAAALEISLSKEQELNALQRQFVSIASHEFRTPLTIIDGGVQRLQRLAKKDGLTAEDIIQRTENIRGAVQRMTRLIESTLAAASMDEGKIKIDIGPCNIEDLISEVCERHREVAAGHVISCEWTDLPETMLADCGAIDQVLTNLLSNAVKYAPDAPDILVRAARNGDQVVISVSDGGVGIAPNELAQIGERFFRASTSTGIAGTGIGLSVARTLVKHHGGAFKVDSKIGEGSTFTISLPISGPADTKRAA